MDDEYPLYSHKLLQPSGHSLCCKALPEAEGTKHGVKVVDKVPHDERDEGFQDGRPGRKETVGIFRSNRRLNDTSMC